MSNTDDLDAIAKRLKDLSELESLRELDSLNQILKNIADEISHLSWLLEDELGRMAMGDDW